MPDAFSLRPLAGGTVARVDGYGGRWQNYATGQGSAASRQANTAFGAPVPLDRWTIDSLLRYNGLARRVALREPYDAVREGITLGDTAEQVALAKYAKKRGALHWVRRARGWARAYGGAVIVMLVDDGRSADQPIDWANIRGVRGARVLTRHECTPLLYGAGYRSWQVEDVEVWNASIGSTVRPVHADRCIVLQGTDLPDDVLARDQGWGGSIFDLVWAELRNYQASADLVPEFVALMTQAVFKQKGLAQGVLAGKAMKIAERYENLVSGLGTLNALALDAEDEDYSVVARPSSGVGELFEVLVQALVAAGEMPRVILLGETPGGLHAGSDSPEVRAWYDSVKVAQDEHYTEPLSRVLDLFLAAANGPTAGRPLEYEVEWQPLYQQTDQEWADLETKRAQRRSVDVASGVVSAAEARRDPDVARLYSLTPEEVEGGTSTATVPEVEAGMDGGDYLDDEDEMQPVVSSEQSAFPPGEPLVGIKEAARVLGRTTGAIMADAVAGKFPMMRDRGRWRLALSQVRAAMTPHQFPAVH